MNFIKIIFLKIWAVVMVLIKFCLFMAVMFAGAWALAPLGTIHSKDIDMSQFNNHPNEMMMNFFQMEYFSGYLFSVTIAVVLAGIYGMWQLHELGVHKAKEHSRTDRVCTVTLWTVHQQNILGYRLGYRIGELETYWSITE